MRELQRSAGTLKKEDCPIYITKNKKELFILETVEEMTRLYNLSDYSPEILAEENDIFRHYIQFTGRNPEIILQEARESDGFEPKEPKKQGNKSLTLDEFKAKYCVKLD